MAARPRLAHLVPKRLAAPVRAAAQESDEELASQLRRRSLALAIKGSLIAEASGDPAQIAAAQRGIETALKINGLLDIEGASQQGAPAIVVTVGPDEEAERLGDDDLGTERPKQPAALS
jgi:hypothetical protein